MACLIMSLPIFSQKDINTDLICIPTEQARSVVADLTSYDFCHQERDSLKAEIADLYGILEQDSILLNEYQLEIGAGLGVLAGKVWRIGLMGQSSNKRNIDACINALKAVLHK